MKTVSIIQSSYIPWKGYFDIIKNSDCFVVFDSVQFTRRDWRNRNQIKTANGLIWLTIPVEVKGKFTQTIWDTEISSPDWADNHWKSIYYAYKKAPYFSIYESKIEELYQNNLEKSLSMVNIRFLKAICDLLGVNTEIIYDKDLNLPLVDDASERLAMICKSLGATHYLSGPSAKAYIAEDFFRDRSIQINYMTYDNYPVYNQLHEPFTHAVSVLDLIFMTGPNALKYLSR